MKTHHLVLLVALTIASLAPSARAGDPGPAPLKLAHSPTTCLDVAQSSKADSAKVLRWACTGNDNQRWNLTPHKGHPENLIITAAHSKKCLDVAGGATAAGSPVVQYKCHGSPHQLWRRVGFLSSGTFSLESVGAPRMCLDLGTDDGNRATLQRCSIARVQTTGGFGIKTQSFLSTAVPSPATTTQATPAKAPEAYRVVVVGDPSVHKTAFIVAAVTGAPPGENVPSTLPPMNQDFVVDGVKATVTFVDTAGGSDYDRLRPISYAGADLVIVMYSIANAASFENIKAKWVPELKYHVPGVPLILVGSHVGLRSDAAAIQALQTKGIFLVSLEKSQQMKEDIGATKVHEADMYLPSGDVVGIIIEMIRDLRNPPPKVGKPL